MNINKSILSTAIAATLTASVTAPAVADTLNFSFDGLFTMVSSVGAGLQNTSYPYYGDSTWGYGWRTPISGTMSFDNSTGAGTAEINYFDFLAAGPIVYHDVTFQSNSINSGDPNDPLLIGNMLFDWNGNNNIMVEIVLDGSGLFAALGSGMMPGDTITTTDCASGGSLDGFCALPGTDGIRVGKYPIGPVPVATSTMNTDGVTIIGDDTIGGSPMDNGPFPSFNFNYDLTSITLDSVTPAVPVPAAAWLFGSGLLGLVGVARRRKQN